MTNMIHIFRPCLDYLRDNNDTTDDICYARSADHDTHTRPRHRPQKRTTPIKPSLLPSKTTTTTTTAIVITIINLLILISASQLGRALIVAPPTTEQLGATAPSNYESGSKFDQIAPPHRRISNQNSNLNQRQDDLIRPPEVLSRPTDLVVGVGSNVTLACPARGTKPLAFVWFQDEKNITSPKTPNSSSDNTPPTTKLLEERRYEISEEMSVEDGQNVTTSILYLFNLNLSDTSIFLCWVENRAGYSISNFSLTVSPDGPISGQNVPTDNSAWSNSSSSLINSQFGIILIGFIIFLALVVVLLFIVRSLLFSDRSSKFSQSSSNSIRKSRSPNGHSNLSNINPGPTGAKLNSRLAMAESDLSGADEDDEDEDDDEDIDNNDPRSSIGSFHKFNPKILASSELNGFMEQMRSGIINMEHHSMSPVIQFNNNNNNINNNNNNTIKKNQHNNFSQQYYNQPMHHFTGATGASQQPMMQYYPNNLNGDGGRCASMTTTTSDLSPGSRTSGPIGYHPTLNSYSSTAPTITNCDLQSNQFNNDHQAPATNTTTTSCASNYQVGYMDDGQMNMIPPQYTHHHYDPQQTIHVSQEQLHIPATIYNPSGIIMMAPPVAKQRPNQFGAGQTLTLASVPDMMQQHPHHQNRPATSHQC